MAIAGPFVGAHQTTSNGRGSGRRSERWWDLLTPIRRLATTPRGVRRRGTRGGLPRWSRRRSSQLSFARPRTREEGSVGAPAASPPSSPYGAGSPKVGKDLSMIRTSARGAGGRALLDFAPCRAASQDAGLAARAALEIGENIRSRSGEEEAGPRPAEATQRKSSPGSGARARPADIGAALRARRPSSSCRGRAWEKRGRGSPETATCGTSVRLGLLASLVDRPLGPGRRDQIPSARPAVGVVGRR